jgi:hypothetical protein
MRRTYTACASSTDACYTASSPGHDTTPPLPSRQATAAPSPFRHGTPPLVPSRQAPAAPSPLRHDTPPLVSPRPGPAALLHRLLSLFVVGAQAYSHGVNGHRGAARSWARGEVATGVACVAPPPLVPPRPTPAIPPPLPGTTPRHLCLLDWRLLHRLLSGTTTRYLCLLDRRLLHRLLSGTTLRRLCLPGRGLLNRLLSLFVLGAQAYSHGVNGYRGAARS